MLSWLRYVKRRRGWVAGNLDIKKILTLTDGLISYALRKQKIFRVPATLKIDLSPLCNLSCTFCIHANIKNDDYLQKQSFDSSQKMSVEQYERIINQLKGKCVGVSLYYYGDPFMHPYIDLMCRIAYDAGLQVHICSNFSYKFTAERIKSIARCGITNLTICVDGLTQETYEITRRGGHIDLVLSNLKQLCQYKRINNLKLPHIEIQYLKYKHNVHELPKAIELFESLGVDYIQAYWGALYNVVDLSVGRYEIKSVKENEILPRCFWPWFSMVIKYNGDVIPCCEHRSESQYTSDSNILSLGNVFQNSVLEIWNSERYRQLRQVVANPRLFNTNCEQINIFCYGCPKLFHTDLAMICKNGKNCSFDDLYTIENNYIIRKGDP